MNQLLKQSFYDNVGLVNKICSCELKYMPHFLCQVNMEKIYLTNQI